MKRVLFLICGPSGSGKTTLAKVLCKTLNIICHFEADMWMVDKNGQYFFDYRRLKYCHTTCQKWTEEAMKIGESVVVSNTTLTKKEAKPYIELAQKYNYNIIIKHLTNQFASIHDVPEEAIKKMRKTHQHFSLNDFKISS